MEHNDAEDDIFNENNVGGADFLKPKEQSVFGIVSVFLGILSLLMTCLGIGFFIGFLGVIFAVLGFLDPEKSKLAATAGLITSLFSIILALLIAGAFFSFLFTYGNELASLLFESLMLK